MIFQWARKSLSRSRSTSSQGRRKAPSLVRPSFEQLEDRTVPTTFTVTSLADTGAGTLRDAITQADATSENNVINFAVSGTISLHSALPDLDGNLTIQGPGASSLTIQEATGGSFGILTVGEQNSASVVTISGVTINGGIASLKGGAIENVATLALSNCTLTNNTAKNGGAVDNQGTLTVTSCVFSGNKVTGNGFGGAIENDGTATITNSTFSGNSGYYGGAIDNGTHGQANGGSSDSGTLGITGSTFSGNSGSQEGGAIESGAGTVTITGSTFTQNGAAIGGAIDNFTSPTAVVNISNSSFSANSVGGFYQYGGAINNDAQMTITNSTFTGNLANRGLNSGFGGAIANGIYPGSGPSASLTVSGSTFSGNMSGYDGGAIANGGTLTLSTSTVSANQAFFGAGIENTGRMTIAATAIINNYTTSNGYANGGGIYNAGTLAVSDSTIADNTATGHVNQGGGGGIYNNTPGTLTLINDTIADNTAYVGAGIWSFGTNVLVLQNTLVAADMSPFGPAQQAYDMDGASGCVNATLSDHNLVGIADTFANLGLVNGVNGNQVGTVTSTPSGLVYNVLNPHLGPLQNNGGPTQTMALMTGSTAIDAGNNAEVPGPYDQRGTGFNRIVNGTVDIGAFEVQPAQNQTLFLVNPAAATPSPVTGTTTSLSVLATDTAYGASSLVYTWSVSSLPSGAPVPTFSVNGTSAADNSVATFFQAGTYSFLATVSDPSGQRVTSTVSVVVNQTLSSLTVSPASVNVYNGFTQQFTATALDQFGKAMTTQPAVTWTFVGTPLGTLSNAGLYTAPTTGTGTATIRASSGAFSGTAQVMVIPIPTIVVSTLADSGAGSLRFAITQADAASGPSLILFTVTGTIDLLTVLPALTKNITIQGPGANLLTVDGNLITGRPNAMLSINSGVAASISGLTMVDGKGNYGGAVANQGTLTLAYDMFLNNKGAYSGGAIDNEYLATLTVTGSTFSGNTASSYGAGIYNDEGTVSVSNSTFFGNSSSFYGGAIASLYGSLSLTNDTIDGNTATYGAGGIYTASVGSNVTVLINTIVAGNLTTSGSPSDISGNVDATHSFNNLIGVGSGSNLVNGVNGNLVGSATSPINPLLGALQNNGGPTLTQALLTGSAAIDAGNNAYAPGPYDQRGPGYARISGGTIDIGAYEVQSDDLVAFWSLPLSL